MVAGGFGPSVPTGARKRPKAPKSTMAGGEDLSVHTMRVSWSLPGGYVASWFLAGETGLVQNAINAVSNSLCLFTTRLPLFLFFFISIQ